MNTIDLIEAGTGALSGASIDRGARIIRNTVLINAHSVNGGGRSYTPKALARIAAMSEGLPAFANHTAKENAFKPRDIREAIGRHRNVKYDAARQRVTSDLYVMPHHDWVLNVAESLGDLMGNSLVSRGLVRVDAAGREHVEDVVAVRSGDFVTDPATTKGLFEHREHVQALRYPVTGLVAGPRVAVALAPGTLKTFPLSEASQYVQSFPALQGGTLSYEALLNAIATALKAKHETDCAAEITARTHAFDCEYKPIVTFADSLVFENSGKFYLVSYTVSGTDVVIADDDQEVVAEFTPVMLAMTRSPIPAVTPTNTEDRTMTKIQQARAAVKAHPLGKKYGKIAGTISEFFIGTTLAEAAEDQWPTILDQRLTLLDSVSVDLPDTLRASRPGTSTTLAEVHSVGSPHAALASIINNGHAPFDFTAGRAQHLAESADRDARRQRDDRPPSDAHQVLAEALGVTERRDADDHAPANAHAIMARAIGGRR
jgi:hypothetical protein